MSSQVYEFFDVSLVSVEAYLDVIKDWDLDAIQLSNGVYTSHHQFINFSKLHIGKRNMSCATAHHGVMLGEAFYFIFPQNNLSIQVNNTQLDVSDLVIIAPGEDATSVFPSNFEAIVLAIPVPILIEYLGESTVNYLALNCETVRHGKIETPDLIEKKQHIANLVKTALKFHHGMSVQALLDVQESILNAATEILQKVKANKSQIPTSNTRLQIVLRALNYINSTQNKFYTVVEVAKASHCSVRSLEYAFKDMLGMSPKQYFVLWRLQIINNHLLKNPQMLIKDVVTQYGVVNLGRFSKDYYNFFGEYPSETKLKAKEF